MSSMMPIKFCGLSTPADVEAANACPPNYAGFVFYPPSKRAVTPSKAAALRAQLDAYIPTVGVFVDAEPYSIVRLVKEGVISVVQLHGSEDAAYLCQLRAKLPDTPLWQAFVVSSAEDVKRAAESEADLVLLDAGKGEGTAFDWELLVGFPRPYALAGGLDAEALDRLAPLVQAGKVPAPSLLDVSSGIEEVNAQGKREKSLLKMKAFEEAVDALSDIFFVLGRG